MGCGGSSATAPTPIERHIVALGVECQPTLIIGETRPCVAVASMADGRKPLVSPVASWSTSTPSIVSVSAIGDVRGVSAGRSAVHVSYGGRQASTEVTVLPGDAVKVAWLADQGAFAPGTRVTMLTGGFYALQSADTGTLQVLIYNQQGFVPVVGSPQKLERGGDAFALSVSFQVPASSTRLC